MLLKERIGLFGELLGRLDAAAEGRLGRFYLGEFADAFLRHVDATTYMCGAELLIWISVPRRGA
jgi:hypothetical protein